jgi:undecaprenyl diphosphate synthase
MNFLEEVDKNNVPEHVAIIMDGNGRWAKKRGKLRVFGHKSGVKAVREAVEGAAEIGVKYLTLYAFSTENWHRPKPEVEALMSLLLTSLKEELQTLTKNNIKLKVIGDISKLPKKNQEELTYVVESTKNNDHMTLTLALSYSSKLEILQAVKNISQSVKDGNISVEDIDEKLFASKLYTCDMPNVDLMIRTSGETRISNFLLWQLAYAELLFLDLLWPDFKREDLFKAIYDFQHRERRFGKTSEQLDNK